MAEQEEREEDNQHACLAKSWTTCLEQLGLDCSISCE